MAGREAKQIRARCQMGRARLLFDAAADSAKARALLAGDSRAAVEGVKRVLALSAKGVDITDVFSDVVKLVATEDLELKRLIYAVLAKHGTEAPDEALMSYNVLHKELTGGNAIARAMALKALVSIQTDDVTDLACESVRRLIDDSSPLVRYEAVMSIPKLKMFDTSDLSVKEDENPRIRLAAAALNVTKDLISNQDAMIQGEEWIRSVAILNGHISDGQVLSAMFSSSPTTACAASIKLCAPLDEDRRETQTLPRWLHQKAISAILCQNPNSLRPLIDSEFVPLRPSNYRSRAEILTPCINASECGQRTVSLMSFIPGICEGDDSSLAKLSILESLLENSESIEIELITKKLAQLLFSPMSNTKLSSIIHLLSKLSLRNDNSGKIASDTLISTIISDVEICPQWVSEACFLSLVRILQSNSPISQRRKIAVAVIEFSNSCSESDWNTLGISNVSCSISPFITKEIPCSIQSLNNTTTTETSNVVSNTTVLNDPGATTNTSSRNYNLQDNGATVSTETNVTGQKQQQPQQLLFEQMIQSQTQPQITLQPEQAQPQSKQVMSLDDFFSS